MRCSSYCCAKSPPAGNTSSKAGQDKQYCDVLLSFRYLHADIIYLAFFFFLILFLELWKRMGNAPSLASLLAKVLPWCVVPGPAWVAGSGVSASPCSSLALSLFPAGMHAPREHQGNAVWCFFLILFLRSL